MKKEKHVVMLSNEVEEDAEVENDTLIISVTVSFPNYW